MLKPAVLCHAGHRDLYHVAWALREVNLRKILTTDLYLAPHPPAARLPRPPQAK